MIIGEYAPAIAATIIWAILTQVLNHGLKSLPSDDKLNWLLAGLLVAMFFGVSTSLLFIDNPSAGNLDFNINLFLGGLLTYPVASSLYYLTSQRLNGRSEYGAVFSKVKPLFSFILGFAILNEAYTASTLVSVGLMSAGLFVFFLGVKYDSLDLAGVFLGLATAVCWALGEYYMKLGMTQEFNGFNANYQALVYGFAAYWVFILVKLRMRVFHYLLNYKLVWTFMVHGIFSFGIAYSLFFKSISIIGIGRTILITAFWPILALIISILLNRLRGRSEKTSVYVIVSAALIVSASVIELAY